jgi:hypothetical protein
MTTAMGIPRKHRRRKPAIMIETSMLNLQREKELKGIYPRLPRKDLNTFSKEKTNPKIPKQTTEV